MKNFVGLFLIALTLCNAAVFAAAELCAQQSAQNAASRPCVDETEDHDCSCEGCESSCTHCNPDQGQFIAGEVRPLGLISYTSENSPLPVQRYPTRPQDRLIRPPQA